MKRWVVIFLSLFVAVASLTGLWNSYHDLGDAKTAGQRATEYSVLLYGICGIPAALGFFYKRKWSLLLLWFWVAGCTSASAISPVAYGETPWIVGLVSGVFCVLLLSPIPIFGSRYIHS